MLKLRIANSFVDRLLGLHRYRPLQADEGLLLTPCWCVHTLFLGEPIDVISLDAGGYTLRCVPSMPPGRVAGVPGARMVVELPAGYCERHHDYSVRVHDALRRI